MTCCYPFGYGTKRQPLHPARAYPGYLEQRIDRIASEEIRKLCRELAIAVNQGIEMHENKKLMTFLNFAVRELEKMGNRTRKRHP